MDIKNIEATKKKLENLILELQTPEPDIKKIDELKGILERIGSNSNLYIKYSDIYIAAEDILINAIKSTEKILCDPFRKYLTLIK